MYRKSRRNGDSSILDLDSLMDILSCLVGVMLFMVIYTVLELGSTAFQVTMPTFREAPAGARRVVVLASGGTVRLLDTRTALLRLLDDAGGEPAADVDELVRRANARGVTEGGFRFSLGTRAVGTASSAALELHVEAVSDSGTAGSGGMPAGALADALQDLDPMQVVLEMWTDAESLDAFRDTREAAASLGFTTRWMPFELELPLTFAVSPGGTVAQRPRGDETKPQR